MWPSSPARSKASLTATAFNFNVISAAPEEIIQSALEGIVPADRIFGTRFRYKEDTGEVDSIIRATAGWGKITVLEEIRASLGISHDNIIYMGDGSSDLPVMMHVNQHDGLTIAVSEAKFITRVARRTVLSDNAMSVLVPVLEEVLRWDSIKIRRFFAANGLMLREWDKTRTDMLTLQENSDPIVAATSVASHRTPAAHTLESAKVQAAGTVPPSASKIFCHPFVTPFWRRIPAVKSCLGASNTLRKKLQEL